MYRSEGTIFMKQSKQKGRFHPITDFMIDLLIAIGCVLIMNTFLIQNLRVEGNSMSPTFENDNRVIMNRVIYKFKEPVRGDVIGFYSDKLNHKIVKRIVGMPGDQIDFKDDMLFVNGIPISTETGDSIISKGDIIYPYHVPQNAYFVVGDNYNNSIDSRFNFIGSVEKDQILGRIDLKIWPFWDNPLLK